MGFHQQREGVFVGLNADSNDDFNSDFNDDLNSVFNPDLNGDFIGFHSQK